MATAMLNEEKMKRTGDWIFNLNNPTETPSSKEIPKETYAEKTADLDTFETRKKRTFVLNRFGGQTDLTETIIKDIGFHFERDPAEVIEKVRRDARLKQRYYITFKSIDFYKIVREQGITINGRRIRGTNVSLFC